jgi:hypothetical protein
MLLLVTLPVSSNADTLFQETFDNQPDYVSNHPNALNLATEATIPDNWYAVRQSSEWDPASGNPDNHETIEILSSNSDKARGGTGKSLVVYREAESPGPGVWTSDGILLKYLPEGYDELYVSFWINFSPEWTKSLSHGTTTKMFRIYSWNPDRAEITQYFSRGGSGPIALWDYQVNSYGVRNRWAFRGGPHGGDNYNITSYVSPTFEGFPRRLINKGDASLNFTEDTEGQGANGETPRIVDQVNGGYISDNPSQLVEHDQIFGASGHWTKMTYYVKMNSAPGVADGTLKQWINDELILSNENIPWTGPEPWVAEAGNSMPKWNVVGFGGNSFFPPTEVDADMPYALADQHEEWYAIDDIIIADQPPTSNSPPSPPTLLP